MWNKYRDTVKSLGYTAGFSVLPRVVVPDHVQLDYWIKLATTDALKKRFCGFSDITPTSAFEFIEESTHTYYVVDHEDFSIVAEFTLENFMGKAAQMHFSGRPGNTPALNRFLSRAVSDQILKDWKDQSDIERPFVEALFGLTPVENRVAVIFALKCGFKKLGVIPGTVPNGTDYSAATLTIKTR